ncbi:FecR family protein [Galbibacter mesophilus]|uniref:FecR family protein n=1 Tax=Galbibacter mesophilus TaxID=379069 RepID=UPI00191F901D|nr:FecR domain-containing protein [Galbibacter mesophilus]MCM5663050.1 FecR domain-containing protein [Galbibacter mesophilus]
MDEKTFKEILERYQKGTATKKELKLLEDFESHFSDRMEKEQPFTSQLHKRQVRNEVFRKIKKEIQPTSPTISWYKIVAGLALLIGLGASYYFITKNTYKVNYIAVSTSANQTKILTLSDSSVVTLNENSALEFPNVFSEEERKVKLTGEAYFKIKKDKNSPFIVEANGIKTTVLGTQFNIDASTHKVNVALVEGSVKVEGLDVDKKLLPNQKIEFDLKKKKVHLQNFSPKEELWWLTGEFVFSNTPLEEVVQILGKKFNKTIILDSNNTGKLSISGTFKSKNLSAILKAVAETLELDFKRVDNEILIYKPKPNSQ